MGVVDVRDVASLELLAMTKPEAAGKRFVCSAENMFMKDQNEYLSELFPESASKIPKRVAPNWLIKFFNNPMTIRPNLQVRMPSFHQIFVEVFKHN